MLHLMRRKDERTHLYYGEIVINYMRQHPNVYISIKALADFCNIGKSTLYKYRRQICLQYGIEYKRLEGLKLHYSSRRPQQAAA